MLEYFEKQRELTKISLRGISESLGLAEDEIEKAFNLDSGLEEFIANYYPRCPDPDVTIGIPPHSDHGLLTFLIQNGVDGLQIQHEGKWINVNAPSGSILVNTCDHLEVCKSQLHT